VDGFLLVLWIVRILFLVLLYVVLYRIIRTLLRDLRSAARESATSLGRVVVVASPAGEPEVGRSFELDTITTLGRDVNNSIVVDDPFASAEHAVLTYRGRGWYVEDLGSTNGTYVNGRVIAGVAPLGVGDEVAIGQVRLRLERPRRP
jgi:pSer/pThr/pTyr-binding forkhead associated (FHA) protein